MPGTAVGVCCGRTVPVETSPEEPAVLGDENGVPAIRVRAAQYVAPGLARGQVGWATGTKVQAFIMNGVLVREPA